MAESETEVILTPWSLVDLDSDGDQPATVWVGATWVGPWTGSTSGFAVESMRRRRGEKARAVRPGVRRGVSRACLAELRAAAGPLCGYCGAVARRGHVCEPAR